MQENGRRLLSFLMVVAMLFSMLPMSVFAQEQETEQTTLEAVQLEAEEPEAMLPQVVKPEETLPAVSEPEQPAEHPATRQEEQEEYPALEFGVPMDVVLPAQGSAIWLTFTPEQDGVYGFTFHTQEYVGVHIYDWEKEYLRNDYYDDGGQMFQRMEGGKTYYLAVNAQTPAYTAVTITAGYSPLQSITFQPITIREGTVGHIVKDADTQQLWYRYAPGMMMSYTATFVDGTVVTEKDMRIHYNGNEYGINTYDNQDYNHQWEAGNTYTITARAMGYEVSIPVTIQKTTIEGISINPIAVIENTCGYTNYDWNPETGSADLPYYYYEPNDILNAAVYTVTYADGSVEHNVGGMIYYEDEWYSLAGHTDQGYQNQWSVGNTYQIDVFVLGQHVQVPVSVIKSPLQSIVFQPITVEENTCGGISQDENGEYYQYYPWDLFYKTSYVATFENGTVIEGSSSSLHYNGSWYEMVCDADQSYENPWLAGNTYALQVEVMGQTVEVPVTIKKYEIPTLEMDTPLSVTIQEGSRNYAELLFTPEESGVYIFTSISDIDTYGDLYEVVEGDTPFVSSDDDSGKGYNFRIVAKLLAGHTYKLQARHISWITCTFQVQVSGNPLKSIAFQPVTVMEGTYGAIHASSDEPVYFRYYEHELCRHSSYTATFADGSQLTGTGDGFEYDGQWYSFTGSSNQSYENQWAAGNTYVMQVEVMGKTAEVPVTITESTVQSIEFAPVTIVEGSCGWLDHAWNPETENHDLEYFRYDRSSILGRAWCTVTFTDGRTWSGYGNESVYIDGQWYSFCSYDNQSYQNQWTVGNAYTIDVYFLGAFAQAPVTIELSPVVSVTAEPVTMYEGVGGSWNSYWPGDGNEYQYYTYYWWNRVTYRVTFRDGTAATIFNGNGYHYNGTYYSLSTFDSQCYDQRWTVGNTYTGTISFMGVSAEVPVTIAPSPVESVVFDPIILDEYTNGSWHWDEGGQYYRYYYYDKIAYTVTFRDGTVKRGTYWDEVEYDGVWYGISTYSDPQSADNPWLVGNTYGVEIRFEGKWYDTSVTISKTTEDNGFTYIAQKGQAVINGCTLQTEILQIPETIDGYRVVGITSLGEALAYAEELRIPDGVTMLSRDILDPYGSMIPLKKLILGKGVTGITAEMLNAARELEQIVVAADNPELCSIDGVVYSKDITKLIAYPAAKQALHKIPDSVTSVSALFEGCAYSNINVQFGVGVKDYKMVGGIIYNADMTEVIKATAAATGSYVMPETVTDIAGYAFTDSNLTSIAVSPGVTYISYHSFYDAINLEEISIPTSVTSITFRGTNCVNLKKVHITDVSAWCNLYCGGDLLYYARDLYLNGEKIVDLVIPETVTEGVYDSGAIAYRAFAYGSFESVSIPSRIKCINWDAFAGCENLKAVNVDDLGAWSTTYFDNEKANPLYYARNLYVNSEKVTDLVLPQPVTDAVYVTDTVYGVSDYAFYNIDIDSLTVPSYVYNIGSEAFYGSSVEKIVLEEGVGSIGYAAFSNTGIKAVTLPDSLRYMEYSVFADCTALEQLQIGSGLITIPGYSFENTALKTVTLPKQIEYVGSYAFANTPLTQVNILCDQVQIGWRTFMNCPLGDLKLGDNITYIEEEAFNGIAATRIEHPASVTQISYRVYALNPNLVSVTIPQSVTYIDSFAFEGDTNLSHVLYTGTQAQWEQLNVWSDELNKATIHYEATGNEVTTEQNCTTIRLYCTICEQWEIVQKKNAVHSFEDGVCTVCGYEGFWQYEADGDEATITGYLGADSEVVLPEQIDGLTVTAFTQEVFAYNRKLTSVTLPDTITEIPEGAFRCCSVLQTVVLGEHVTTIGDEAFLENWSLCKIDLPNGLTAIGEAAFYGCGELVVKLPESVRTIGAMAFYRCCALERVEIPEGVTEIAYQTFSACWNLEEVVIPDTVTTIGYYAFSGASIEELIVPAGVQRICSDAFYMNNMKTVLFQGNMPQMENAFDYSGISMFYAASNKTWSELPGDHNSWYACKIPTITRQPANQTVQPGEQVTLSAEGYGHRLSYQWYFAAPNTKRFVPVGGDRIELTLTVDQDTSGARAYCMVTDILGQTAKTDTVILRNPTKTTGIRLNKLPYTLEYDLRQELRTRGLEVMLTFDDGTQEAVLDYTVSGYDPNVGGVQTVTVAYGDYTATFEVTVNEEKLNFTNAEQNIELSAPEGAVEQDVELVVDMVYPEQALPELPEIPEILQENETVIFDITLEKDGEAVQPTETVQVSIPVPEHMESKRCKVFHISDDGVATDMNASYKDGRMVFSTGHFSYYAVVETSSNVSVSGTVIGGNVTGTVVRLLSGGEVLESMSVSTSGTYLFENVGSGQYVIEAVREGVPAFSKEITVTDQDVSQDIIYTIYTVVFVNEDGSQLSKDTYCQGEAVVVPAAPTKAEDEFYTYTFAGWDKAITDCEADTTYTATYTAERKPYIKVVTNGQQTEYSSLTKAVENAPAGSMVQLVGSFADSVVVTRELVLDLNGFDLTGNITVAAGAKLSVKDSRTDDYTVMDEAGYGKLTGTVIGAQAADGYMLIREETGVSFHRIDLSLTDMTLRPEEVGVYYKSSFAGDELVAQNVARYGVALSLAGAPTVEIRGICSWYDSFAPGAAANAANGTLLYGVMKLTNSATENAENAQMSIYGSAYVLTKDGQYLFGESVNRSLREQVELIDSRWSTLDAQQKRAALEMYAAYEAILENWNIPNIKSDYAN